MWNLLMKCSFYWKHLKVGIALVRNKPSGAPLSLPLSLRLPPSLSLSFLSLSLSLSLSLVLFLPPSNLYLSCFFSLAMKRLIRFIPGISCKPQSFFSSYAGFHVNFFCSLLPSLTDGVCSYEQNIQNQKRERHGSQTGKHMSSGFSCLFPDIGSGDAQYKLNVDTPLVS